MKNLMLSLTLIFTFSITNYSQSELTLSSCDGLLFEVNNSTSNINQECSRNVVIEKIASYSTTETCSENIINWVIFVDLWNDGVYDFEYKSSLPPSDTIFDDTNGNSIPDIYIEPTLNNEVQQIELLDLEGPFSEHTVYWKAVDECDIEVSCTQDFRLLDTQTPIPYCIPVTQIVFDNPIDIEVYAMDFMIYPYDNCTPQEELRFSFSGDSIVPTRYVTCDDFINSPVELDVYVWDNQDNRDYCTVFLNVIPTPLTDCFPYQIVEGYVKTEDDKPIQNAEVKLYCNLPEYPKSEFTDADGYYSFDAVQDYSPGCYIIVDKEDEYITSVSTLDLVKIIRHILSLQPFTTAYQRLAADVTSDDKVSASDLLLHRKLILGVISELPANSSWIFLDESYQFAEPNDPWTELGGYNDSPYSIMLSPASESPYNFIGVKLGNIVD